MYKVILSENSVVVRSKNGTETEVDTTNRNYEDARNAALDGDWDEYYSLAKDTGEEDLRPLLMGIGIASSIPDMLRQIKQMTGIDVIDATEPEPTINDAVTVMKGLIDDGLVDAGDLGLTELPKIDEHDLSNWNGSPIFYDNEDEAREQARKSMGFWEFHDFGLNQTLQSKYRYATVPTGFGPTAPEGYDWVCLKRS